MQYVCTIAKKPCSAFITFSFSTITWRLISAKRSREQLSHKPSWSVNETSTLSPYIKSVTISVLSM